MMKWIATAVVILAFSCRDEERTKGKQEAQRRAKFEMGCPEAGVRSLGEKAFGVKGRGKRWVWEYTHRPCEGGTRWRAATKKPLKIEKAKQPTTSSAVPRSGTTSAELSSADGRSISPEAI